MSVMEDDAEEDQVTNTLISHSSQSTSTHIHITDHIAVLTTLGHITDHTAIKKIWNIIMLFYPNGVPLTFGYK